MAVGYKVSRLVGTIIVYIGVATGLVFELADEVQDSFAWPEGSTLEWHDCLYYVVVTTTTVGYGDIRPISAAARIMMTVIIIVGFVIFPVQVAALVQALFHQPAYADRLPAMHSLHHVCLCGIFDYSTLNRVLSEIFHKDYCLRAYGRVDTGRVLSVAILSPYPPDEAIQLLLLKPQYRKSVRFLVGSSKNPKDLRRVRIEEAVAVYLVVDVRADSLREEEDSVLLSSVAVCKYLQIYEHNRLGATAQRARVHDDPWTRPPRAETFTLLAHRTRPLVLCKLTHSARCRPVLADVGVDVALSVQEFKCSLLGYGAVYPGLLDLFLNLNRSRDLDDADATDEPTTQLQDSLRPNLHQLSTAAGYCHSALRHLPFLEAVLFLYRRTSGLVVLVGGTRGAKVHVAPQSLTIKDLDTVFVIADSLATASSAVHLSSDDDLGASSGKGRSASDAVDMCVSALPSSPPASRLRDDAQQGERDICSSLSMQPAEARYHEGKECDSIQVRRRSRSDCSSHLRLSPFSSFLSPARLTAAPITMAKSAEALCPLDEWPRWTNHFVVVLVTSTTTKPDIRTVMLPILFLLRTLRSISVDPVVVLLERGSELMALVEEMEQSRPDIFRDAHFYSGTARNLDHLRACCVQWARSVILLSPPAVEHARESGEASTNSLTRVVQADSQTVVASLNVQLLLNDKKWVKRQVFTITELVYESNAIFLTRNDSYGCSSSLASTPIDHKRTRHCPRYTPWSTDGAVFVQSSTDTLMAQTMHYPGLLRLWETLLGLDAELDASLRLAVCDEELLDVTLGGGSGGVKNNDETPGITPNPTTSSKAPLPHVVASGWMTNVHVLRVPVPPNFVGMEFGMMMESFLLQRGCIVVALYRQQTPTTTPAAASLECYLVPVLVIAPAPSTLIQKHDEVFIFK